MAVTGKFEADFSQFNTAVDQAQVTLRGFESESRKVETQLSRMTDSLSGRKLIQEATLMAEAIERVGGVGKLTDAELARMSGTAAEAAAKLRAMGLSVPAHLDAIAESAKRAEGGLSGAARAISQTDNVLDLFGVNLGPARKAMADLGDASGKTASQLGLFGTASLTAGAALGGWEIGRKISELGGLDEKIGNATAKLLGWGDVAGQQAAAAADTLAKASKIAGIEITNMDTAIALLSADAKDAADSMGKFAGAVDIKVPADFAKALEKIHGQVEILRTRDAEGFGELTNAIKEHLVSAADIARVYNVDTRAAQQYIDEVTKGAAIEQKNHDIVMNVRKQQIQAIEEKAEKERKANEERLVQLQKETDAEWKLVEAKHQTAIADADATIAAQKRAEADKWKQAAADWEATLAGRRAGGSVDVSGIPGANLLGGKTVADFARDLQARYGGPTGIPLAPGMDIGTMALEAFRAAAQKALAQSLVKGTPSWWNMGGQAAPPPITVNVSGVWDARSKQELAGAVSDAFARQLRATQQFGAA